MKALDESIDVVESLEFSNTVRNSNRIGAKPYSSIVENICSCGHERRQHDHKITSSFNFDESCNVKNCCCPRYLE